MKVARIAKVVGSARQLSSSHFAVRTKHNMADSQYTYNLVYYPYEVARVRLPMGLPAGGVARCFPTMQQSDQRSHDFLATPQLCS